MRTTRSTMTSCSEGVGMCAAVRIYLVFMRAHFSQKSAFALRRYALSPAFVRRGDGVVPLCRGSRRWRRRKDQVQQPIPKACTYFFLPIHFLYSLSLVPVPAHRLSFGLLARVSGESPHSWRKREAYFLLPLHAGHLWMGAVLHGFVARHSCCIKMTRPLFC